MPFRHPVPDQTMSDDIQQWVENKFEGLTREQLRHAGNILGETFGPNTSDKTMRIKLCEKVGTTPAADLNPAPPPSPIHGIGPFDPKPILTDVHKWGGLRHHVLVFPQGNDSDNSSKYVQLTWENQTRHYSFGITLNLPHPLYEALKNSMKGNLVEKEIKNASGELVRIDYDTVYIPRYPHQYIGPVPGTEDLPCSLRHYWQIQARKHNNFIGMHRRILTQIRSDLYGPVGRDFYKDLTDQDILFDIHTFLGTEDLAEAA